MASETLLILRGVYLLQREEAERKAKEEKERLEKEREERLKKEEEERNERKKVQLKTLYGRNAL